MTMAKLVGRSQALGQSPVSLGQVLAQYSGPGAILRCCPFWCARVRWAGSSGLCMPTQPGCCYFSMCCKPEVLLQV